jgi:dihydroneopterin aldolase / 2-amino-4-hydroxy-6-hydroxymethyldihydropteridine diphosphokinase
MGRSRIFWFQSWDKLHSRRTTLPSKDYITLTGLKIKCIIGIFAWERKRKQDVVIDLKFICNIRKASRRDNIQDTIDYKKIAKTTIQYVESSRFQLVETLAEKLAALLLRQFHLRDLSLSVYKPGAIRGSQTVGVNIQRANHPPGNQWVVFSLGSNIDPASHLAYALNEIDQKYGLVKVSHVYETSPVNLKKQPVFWNMAAAVETNDPPLKIKNWLKNLEKGGGRVRQGNPNGPRTLDVDLILWNEALITNQNFSIPHPDIAQKAFVLFPLTEIFPGLKHPKLNLSYLEMAAQFDDSKQKIKMLPTESLPAFPLNDWVG